MFQGISGITPDIDSCGGLIVQQTARTYNSIQAHNKRWLDPEDILQEGLIAALSASKSYRRGKGAKFSTYLYTGLKHHLARYRTSLSMEKRSLAGIVELDAPLSSDSDTTMELAGSVGIDSQEEINCIKSFVSLCRAVSSPAIEVLVRGFLFSDPRKATPQLVAEISGAAQKLGVCLSDFQLLTGRGQGAGENIRKKLLTAVVTEVRIHMGTEESIRCLECTECAGEFSIAAVREGRFIVSTMTCRTCYRKMQAAPSSVSCFGKRKRPGKDGFSKAETECRLHCPDRKVCKQQIKELKKMGGNKNGSTDIDDVNFDDVEEKSKTATAKADKPAKKKPAKADATKTKKKADKPAKAAKPAKAKKAKAEEEDDDPSPKEAGPRWPFKKGSSMRYVFQRMFGGVNKKALQEEVEKGGYNWPLQLKKMRQGKRKTHTWKLNEEGSTYKIYDLKYIGPKVSSKKADKEAA